MAKKRQYDEQSITMLKGPDKVRKRPAVIFGSDGIEGCSHSVFEIISNSIDEAREGYGTLINVWLPPFESKYHIQLNDILCDMGMPRSFGPAAQFKPMSDDALWLSFVQQDAVIKVDEEGTEAAAITSAGMLGATAIPEPPRVIDFHCDHPFLYLITENSTGTILFAGKFSGN